MRGEEDFLIEKFGRKPKLNKPIAIFGLPGVGNVARIVTDQLIISTSATKYMNIFTYYYPATTFILEDHTVDLPKIEIYYKKRKRGRDLIFVSGDAQPSSDRDNYHFCEFLLSIVKSLGATEIITLGGIPSGASKPSVYVASTEKRYIKKLEKLGVNTKSRGAVVILGAAGILLSISKFLNMKGFALLADTLADPSAFGFKAAKNIISVLKSYLNLEISTKDLDAQIKEQSKQLKSVSNKIVKRMKETPKELKKEISYIG